MPWNTTFAFQKAFGPAPAADTARISLRNPRVCFPAARRAELATDAAFVAATHGNGARLWDDEELRDVGPDSDRLSHRHRTARTAARLAREAQLRAGATTPRAARLSTRCAPPATSPTSGGGGSLAHAWMLPEGAVQRLRGAQPQLELTYSLTLLKPREYRIPTDGKRHALPGLGYCSAEVDEPGNRIEVDCFSAFTHSAQISAELNEIPASRVYEPRGFRAGLRAMAVQHSA